VRLIPAFRDHRFEPDGDRSRCGLAKFILADNVGYGDLGAYGGGELPGAPTPSIDQLAREGLRLTQFLVEPACTPSRAALMTGQYSIRSGLSLIAIEGSPNTLSAHAFTMGETPETSHRERRAMPSFGPLRYLVRCSEFGLYLMQSGHCAAIANQSVRDQQRHRRVAGVTPPAPSSMAVFGWRVPATRFRQ
jgi:hypothetical protein